MDDETPVVEADAAPEETPIVEPVVEAEVLEEIPHVPSKPFVLDGPPSGPAALTAWESLSGTVNTH